MDKFNIKLSPAAARDLDRLEEKIAGTILDRLSILKENPFPRGKLIKKIKGTKFACYRLRIGKYRLFYIIEGTEIVILKVISRKNAEKFIKTL